MNPKGTHPVVGSNGIIGYHDSYTLKGPLLTIGRSGNVGNPHFLENAGWAHNTTLYVDDFKENEPRFIYYFLQTIPLAQYRGGSAVPTLNRNHIHPIKVVFPKNIFVQKAIADTLSCLDAKIEVNNKIIKNLEKQAQAIFKSWFIDFEPFQDGEFVESELGPIPKGWRVKSLDEIARYINGLAMQRYRPKKNETSLPVVKIRELRQRFTDASSDRCSENIDSNYIIDDGDMVFSWSGSLLVDIWAGGKAGLNQHLFKVTSEKYPKWFYYHWTKFYLKQFQNIAKSRATTMGHIKRGHLKKTKVLVPNKIQLGEMSLLMSTILKSKITLRIENTTLAALRDTLLPKLMSGEIEVPVEQD